MKNLIPYSLAVALLAVLLAGQPGGSRAQTRKPKGRALLVGISNYQDSNVPSTRGAEEDAIETAEFIKSQYGFLDSEIKVLRGKEATASNIIAEFQHWLIEGTQPGDRVFFLYAGHGSQLPDDNGDEDDDLDETLAPYDVKLDGANMIRDDEIGRLVAQLSGRLAVLLFDSCHSGTITRAPGGGGTGKSDARYLPMPKQIATARALGTRDASSDYEVRDLPQDSRILKTRDLKLVTAKAVGPASGIVVISAAQAGQVAFSMDVGGGRQRGALSYVFCEAQQNSTPTLKELGEEINTRFTKLHRDNRLKGTQQPEVEVISTIPLNGKPLFADEMTIPAIALANPSSALKVTLRSGEDKQRYKVEEKISYEVTTNAPGWLYLLVFSEKNVATCVFPTNENADDRDNYVRTGAHRLPRSKYFYAQDPIGKDVVIALLSSVKLNLGDKEEMTWDEVFDRLRSKKLAGFVKTRGVGTKAPGQSSAAPASLDDADWQAASLVIETVAKPTGPSAQPARRNNLNRR